MARRIITARDQYDMAEPWREAASSPWADANGLYMGPMKTKHKPYRDAYSEDENGNCVSCGVHFSQPHKGPHEASRHTAVPKHPDAQWGADVKRHIDQQGGWGLTMKEHPGDAPTSGFMVSHPGEREVSRSRLDPHSIRDYVSDRADLINSDPDNYYGGWEADRTPESGKGGQPGWYHDVSKNVQDPRDTAELALKNNQQAVYDLDHDEEVSTPDMVNRATSPGIGLMSRRNKWLRDG